MCNKMKGKQNSNYFKMNRVKKNYSILPLYGFFAIAVKTSSCEETYTSVPVFTSHFEGFFLQINLEDVNNNLLPQDEF